MAILTGFEMAPYNATAAGIVNLYVKGKDDDAYYNLGITRGTKSNQEAKSTADTLLRPIPYGRNVLVTAQSFGASSTEILLLDDLILNQPLEVIAQLTDGRYLVVESPDELGLRWKLECTGDMTDARFIEYTFGGNFLESEMNALVTANAPSLGNNSVNDALYDFTQAANRSSVSGNGLVKVEVRGTDEAGDYVDFGDFNNGKYTIECLGPDGKGARAVPRTHTIKFAIDYEGLQTSSTETNLIATMNTYFLDWKLTHFDGLVLEIGSGNVGAHAGWINEGNVDAHGMIRAHIEGSMTAPYTAWDDLWTAP
jgi:hypothetical protein